MNGCFQVDSVPAEGAAAATDSEASAGMTGAALAAAGPGPVLAEAGQPKKLRTTLDHYWQPR